MSKRFEIQTQREDRRFALIASILANANRDRKKRRRPFKIDDFMPKPGGRARQTPQEQAAILRSAVMASRNGRRA